MPIPLPPKIADEYRMRESVMRDEGQERGPLQKLSDLMFGRTIDEQVTSALTGPVGTVVPMNPLSKAAWYIARRRMLPEVVESLERPGERIPLNVRKSMAGQGFFDRNPDLLGAYMPRQSLVQDITPPGVAMVDLERAMRRGNPFSTVGHEMTHAAQDVAGRVDEAFPGLMPEAWMRGSYVDIPDAEYLPYFTSGRFPHTKILPWKRIQLTDEQAFVKALYDWFIRNGGKEGASPGWGRLGGE